MNKELKKQQQRLRRKQRVRVFGTSERPRLSVYRSLNHIYAQVIDDVKGITLAAACDKDIQTTKEDKQTKMEIAAKVGGEIAKKTLEKGIKAIVFDKGGFRYHGRVKVLAEKAREAGLQF